ncbi:MAG: PAS domain S-box protein [Methylococcaceae bacterium]|nr:PAS domain S-box protein [Methylococcaceae bacterium]
MEKFISENDDFLKISGYTREEIIGKEHNIIRHPNVPAEIFEDMWASIKSMRPWSGIIKNRSKNGGFY